MFPNSEPPHTETDTRVRYRISGVCCTTEETVLRKCLDGSIGPDRYDFNLLTLELHVDGSAGEQQVLREVRRAGFNARPVKRVVDEGPFWARHREGLRTAVAGALAAAGLLLPESGTPAARFLLLSAIALGGWKIFFKAWVALRARTLDMNVLMTVALIGALLIDRWGEGAAVIVLFSLALMLESYSASRSRRAVRSLLALSPTHCSVLRNGREEVVDAGTVSPGDLLFLRPGERVALDGEVVKGSSDLHQSAITGESEPVLAGPGTTVYAGSLNGRGQLQVRVTKRFDDTTLARIVHLIEESQQQRAPVQSLVDRFARIYTPALLGLAALVAVIPPLAMDEPFQEWFYRSLVLLVIACPCALVISTPVTLVSALTNAARKGILVKGGKHIEMLGGVRAIAIDKTGTLTEGKPRLTDCICLNSLPDEQVFRIAAAMEFRSEHPLANAILAEAARRGIDYADVTVERFEALPGRGIRATIGGTAYHLGNRRMSEDYGFWSNAVDQLDRRLAAEGKTAVILGSPGEAIAVLAMRDTARTQSGEAVAAIRRCGIEHVVMLSGDHPAAAQRVAHELGITEVRAALLPEHKVNAIRDLQQEYGSVAMVGDGMNDAPALAAASAGIAMGVSGTDASLETADVVLMSDELGKLPHLLLLSQKAMAIIRQNIALALGIKVLFLALSVAGISTLWMALLADDGAALAVIANGLRILSFKGAR